MPGVNFQRHQPGTGGQRPGQPDRAVAAKRPDLQNEARVLHSRQQMQQFALGRRDGDGRHAGGGAFTQRTVQGRIGRQQQSSDVTVHRRPLVLIHSRFSRKAINAAARRNQDTVGLGG